MESTYSIGVIGANGFIGQHLVTQLTHLKSFSKLILFGTKDKFVQEEKLNSEHISFEYIQINLKNKASYQNKLKKIDILYYLASESIPANTWKSPASEINTNLIPFVEFLEEVSTSGVKKIVFSSSAGTIYGPSLKKITETSDKKPFNPHGITKLSMEYFLEYNRVKNGTPYEIYRLSNVYGPGQDTTKGLGLINTLLENIIQQKPVSIFGEGENIRNYIHVKDVSKILVHVLKNPIEVSDIFNLASNDTLSIKQIIRLIEKTLNLKIEIKHLPNRSSDNPAIRLSNQKLISTFPSIIFTPIKQGILDTYNSLI